jgi:hypothetical protein
MPTCSDSNDLSRASHQPHSPSPRRAGRGETPPATRTKSFSRHNVPEPCRPPSKIDSPPPKEGGEAPKGASQPWPRSINKRCRRLMPGRGCAPYRGAPAFRRYAAALVRNSDIPDPAPGHVSWERGRTHDPRSVRGESRRALPALSCHSPVTAPHASALVPKDLMPEAAPARVASPRGSTAPAPHFGSHPECVPRMSGISIRNQIQDDCQDHRYQKRDTSASAMSALTS